MAFYFGAKFPKNVKNENKEEYSITIFPVLPNFFSKFWGFFFPSSN
jgi:hypothetical protein